MRTALCVATSLAVFVSAVPASAQDPRVVDHGKCAGIGIAADERQTRQKFGGKTGISLDVPIGKVMVAPEFLDGEPVYIRRTTPTSGLAVVEVSTTPFVSDEGAVEVAGLLGRPDQPAGW
jgi:hypothetical protein